MKKILLPAFLIAFLSLVCSCHKDSKVIPDDFYFKASKNNADWGATANCYTIPGDSIRLTALKPAGEEQIYINIKFNGAGIYPLTGNQAKFFTTAGTDAVTSQFKLDTTQNSSLTVTCYSKSTHIISGSFNLYLLENTAGFTGYNPLNFSDGFFRVKLPD